MSMTSPDELLKKALDAFNGRNIVEAERLFRALLSVHPDHVGGLNLLTVLLMSVERFAEAEQFIARAVALNQNSDVSFYNYGLISMKLSKPEQAIAQFEKALKLNPRVADTWNNRGTVLNNLKEHERAIVDFDQAISLDPNHAGAVCNKAKALAALERYDESLAAYERVLRLKPDLADAWLGRAALLYKLERFDEALAAYDQALAFRPDLADAWLGRAALLRKLERFDEAIAAYDRALGFRPDLADAWLGRAALLRKLERFDEAIAAYDRALGFRPDLADAWLGRGSLLHKFKRPDEALAAYDRALALKPDMAEAWYERGRLFSTLTQHDEAFAAYDKAFVLKPELVGLAGERLHTKMHICDWKDLDADTKYLIQRVQSGEKAASPFVLLSIASSAQDQLRCAALWSPKTRSAAGAPTWQDARYGHDRIRVAYLSADFRDHAVSHLMAGIFEGHDAKRFETFALSFGPTAPSAMRIRLEKAFDQFINVRGRTDIDVAHLMRTLEIDIAVDLMGHTLASRPGIFSYRPAPVQVSYLGYAGTTGADYIDYLMADHTVVPPGHRHYYSEKIVYLPHTFFPNDVSTRPIAERVPDRTETGLPQRGFVFCAFGNAYKLNPEVIDSWARILNAVTDSVLWLSPRHATAVANLSREMAERGVNPKRLLFAGRVPSLADHLARHRLADLYLDTLPYNAHTSASDALWAGLPVLTQIGNTFAGRVGASLLNAIGLPELVTETRRAYEKMAVDLAHDSEKLALIRNKLAHNRLTTPLFDTQSITRHIEDAYIAMYERFQSQGPADHIQVLERGNSRRTVREDR
jgi:protein O-GlcNAc transferase